jgi:DNA-directed RNA polymerase subunit RPC12/RpoP
MRSVDLEGTTPAAGVCAKCGDEWSYSPDETGRAGAPVERCGSCGGRAFFVQRDFDQRIGCAIMALSIAAAFWAGWKFGWIWFTPVLLATVLIDWTLAVTIKPVTICYRCDAEYRAMPLNPRHRPYDPHVAERYAEKKTLRRMGE